MTTGECRVCDATTGDGILLCRTHDHRLGVELRAVVGEYNAVSGPGPRRASPRRPGPWRDGVRGPAPTPHDPQPAPWPDERSQLLAAADVGLAAELELTRTRRDRASVQDGARAGGERGLVWNDRASEVATDLQVTLHGWAVEVARAAEDPRDPVAALDPGDAVTSARWLLRNRAALRRHDGAGHAYDEIIRVIDLARRTVDLPGTARSFHVGPCPMPGERTICDGQVWAYIAAVQGETSWLRCSTDAAHQWDTTRWLRAGRLILARATQAAPPPAGFGMRCGEHGILVSVAEAEQLYGVPRATLYRWAHEDGWTPFGGPRSRHWPADQVQASHDRRRRPGGASS